MKNKITEEDLKEISNMRKVGFKWYELEYYFSVTKGAMINRLKNTIFLTRKPMPLNQHQVDRIVQLAKFGLKYNGKEFTLNNDKGYFDVHWTEVTCACEEEWNKIITAIKNGLGV